MIEQANARSVEDIPPRPARKFPLWAGDVPVADSQTIGPAAPGGAVDPTSKSIAPTTNCTALSELAARKRQATPPPLPKPGARITAPPLTIIAPPPARDEPAGSTLAQPGIASSVQSVRPAASLIERGQQLPCWLTSLVVHLCLVIVLNSYVMYCGGYKLGGTSSTGSVLSTTYVSTSRFDSAQDGSPDVDSGADLASFDLSTPEAASIAPLPTETAASVAGPPVEFGMPPVAWPESLAISVEIPHDVLPLQRNQAVQHPRPPSAGGSQTGNPGTTTRAVPPIDQIPSPSADAVDRPLEERVKNAIVDQFIEYDLGHLRGEEAARALREFQSLRPDSIPAVVRGLNRSARIAGTCPVMVLSRRLEEMLNETSDPAMIRYAFENLGRDVPRSASHYQRIETLRQRLLNRQKQQVAAALVQQGIAADDILLARMAPLFNAGPDRLNKALGDPNAVIRQVAAMQIENRLDEFNDLEKRRLARSLIRLLTDVRPEPAAAAHAALRKLAGGDDYGPAPGAPPADIAEAVRDWNRAFSASGDVSDERVAKGLLALARSLERRGRNEAAAQRYRDICERFPESAAAKEAEQQLELLEAAAQ